MVIETLISSDGLRIRLLLIYFFTRIVEQNSALAQNNTGEISINITYVHNYDKHASRSGNKKHAYDNLGKIGISSCLAFLRFAQT